MRAWMWMAAAVIGCRGRKEALPTATCPAVDAIVQPMEAERAELHQKYPPTSPERWVERAIIDTDAADAIEDATLPAELSEPARAAYVSFLREMAAEADALAEQYNLIADFDKSQDELRDRIDEYSAGMDGICNSGVEGGCEFEPPLPPNPDKTLASLREFVAQAERSHVQDPRAEQIWQMLVGALQERVVAMEEEESRTGDIAAREEAFAAAEGKEKALLESLVDNCPPGPSIAAADTEPSGPGPGPGPGPGGVPGPGTPGPGGTPGPDGRAPDPGEAGPVGLAPGVTPGPVAPGEGDGEIPAVPSLGEGPGVQPPGAGAVGEPGTPPPPGNIPPDGEGAEGPPSRAPAGP